MKNDLDVPRPLKLLKPIFSARAVALPTAIAPEDCVYVVTFGSSISIAALTLPVGAALIGKRVNDVSTTLELDGSQEPP